MKTEELLIVGVVGYAAYRLLSGGAAPTLQDGTDTGAYQAPPSGTVLGNVEGVSVGPSTHSRHGRRTPRTPSNIPPGAPTPTPGTGSVTPSGAVPDDSFQRAAVATAAAQKASVASALAQGQAVRDAAAQVQAVSSAGLAATSAALRKGYTYVPPPVSSGPGRAKNLPPLGQGQSYSKAFVDSANANMLASANKLDAARAARDAKVAAADAARAALTPAEKQAKAKLNLTALRQKAMR